MFKLYKEYLKWKLKCQIKDRLLELQKSMNQYSNRQHEWEIKKQLSSDRATPEKFELIRKEQISFSNEEWKRCYQEFKATEAIIATIEQL